MVHNSGSPHDPDTTLYNYRYRYYSPSLGRFVQVDPVGVTEADLHLYQYVGNNPVVFTDSMGVHSLFLVAHNLERGETGVTSDFSTFGSSQLSAGSYQYDAAGRLTSQTDARTGTTTMTYDLADQLITATTPSPAAAARRKKIGGD